MKKQMLAALLLLPLSSLSFAKYTSSDLDAAAAEINKSLPVMVDSVTKFTTVTVDPSTFHYHYQVVNIKASDLDINKFTVGMKGDLSKVVCSDQFAKGVFDSGINISFDYIDKDSKPIASVIFKPGDCSK